jgi:hypothetical protein
MVSEFLRSASTRDERAQHALKLLCADRGAVAGYLYLVGDVGLSLAASHGPPAAPAGLQEYVEAYFDREVSSSGDQTAVLTGTQMASALVPFRDESGLAHHPLLMASLADGVSRYAGVAMLVEAEGGARERPVGGATLVAALSAHLLELGDANGAA